MQERVVATVRAAVSGEAVRDQPDQPPPALAARRRRVLVAAAWCLAFRLRFDPGVPPYYETLFRRTILLVVAIKLAVFVALRLLQPLVALRVDPGHGGALGRAVACLVASLAVYFVSPVGRSGCRARSRLDWLLLLGLVAGARLLARTILERRRGGLIARGKEALIVGAGTRASW